MSDSNGVISWRAWLFSGGSDGEPIRKYNPRDYMRVKPTPPHALSHANTETDDDLEERARVEREARRAFDGLPGDARELLRLVNRVTTVRDLEMPYPKAQRTALEAVGWLFVRQHGNGQVMMTRQSVENLTHEEAGERLGLSVHQVRRRLNKIPAVVAKLALLRGWV